MKYIQFIHTSSYIKYLRSSSLLSLIFKIHKLFPVYVLHLLNTVWFDGLQSFIREYTKNETIKYSTGNRKVQALA